MVRNSQLAWGTRIGIVARAGGKALRMLAVALLLWGSQTACAPPRSRFLVPAANRPQAASSAKPVARLVHFQDSKAPRPSDPVMGPPEPKKRDRTSENRPVPTRTKSVPPLGPILATAPNAPPPLPYTVPGLSYRVMATFATTAAIGVASEVRGAGEEISQSLLFSPEGAAGKLGRTTAPTVLGGQTVARFNRQQGAATGFTFGSRNNIFTARSNPAGGAGGRCRELAGAGFFGGDHRRCNQAVRRRR